MINAEEIKTIALELGADRCGIASAERFDKAPRGFHPREIYSRCNSVVVFLKQLPPEVIDATCSVQCRAGIFIHVLNAGGYVRYEWENSKNDLNLKI